MIFNVLKSGFDLDNIEVWWSGCPTTGTDIVSTWTSEQIPEDIEFAIVVFNTFRISDGENCSTRLDKVELLHGGNVVTERDVNLVPTRSCAGNCITVHAYTDLKCGDIFRLSGAGLRGINTWVIYSK